MKQYILALVLFSGIAIMAAAQSPTNARSPYGICAHLGSDPADLVEKKMVVMKQAGIDWARADFTWTRVESKDGNWNFDRFDKIIELGEKHGVTVLPILDYDTPWATPAYKHLDRWLAYVDKTVRRYKDKVKYWEVWNEQNLDGFWREKPDAKNYQILLEATYKKIKEINPELQVLYGGLAGIPFDYIDVSLDAGAAKYFDVFNIHPYRSGLTSKIRLEAFAGELSKLRSNLDAKGAQGKPIWITEFGWATPPGSEKLHRGIVQATKSILAPEQKTWKVAVLFDERHPTAAASKDSLKGYLSEGMEAVDVKLEDLESLDPAKVDALLLPPSENCLTPWSASIDRFVKQGGTLFLFGGVPLYYDTEMKDGILTRTGGSNRDRDRFRIAYQAWWHKVDGKEVIPKEAKLTVAEEAKPAFEGLKITARGERFLRPRGFKDGDRLIPILTGKAGEYEAPSVAIYRYDSDYKGAVVVSTIMGQQVNTTPDDQAAFLPTAILMSLQNGVERYFWYEFQAPEQDDYDKEHHFGIVHRDLSPKPAYEAYKTLVRARPAGSKNNPGTWIAGDGRWNEISWKRPDGKTGIACWVSGDAKLERKVDRSKLVEAFDHLGNPIELQGASLELKPEIRYLIIN